MELWDVYDDEGNRTERVVLRGSEEEILGDGENYLVVHVFIRNNRGEFLIQKRSMKKKNMPGTWDVTGGGVVAGEDGKSAAIREVKEELGIEVKAEDIKLITRYRGDHYFVDIWDVLKDIDPTDCLLQADEVDEVKYVTKEELLEIFENGDYVDEEYIKVIRSYYRE